MTSGMDATSFVSPAPPRPIAFRLRAGRGADESSGCRAILYPTGYVTGLGSDNAFKITPGGVIAEIIDATGDTDADGVCNDTEYSCTGKGTGNGAQAIRNVSTIAAVHMCRWAVRIRTSDLPRKKRVSGLKALNRGGSDVVR